MYPMLEKQVHELKKSSSNGGLSLVLKSFERSESIQKNFLVFLWMVCCIFRRNKLFDPLVRIRIRPRVFFHLQGLLIALKRDTIRFYYIFVSIANVFTPLVVLLSTDVFRYSESLFTNASFVSMICARDLFYPTLVVQVNVINFFLKIILPSQL